MSDFTWQVFDMNSKQLAFGSCATAQQATNEAYEKASRLSADCTCELEVWQGDELYHRMAFMQGCAS